MGIFKVKKGNHAYSPVVIRPLTFKKNTYYTVPVAARFDKSCAVDVSQGNDDQFNKLCGVAFNLLNPTRNSVMCGWRYNPTINKFELTPYWHDETGKNHFFTENLFTVDVDELFFVDFIITEDAKVKVAFERERTNNLVYNYYTEYTLSNSPVPKKLARHINSWFGGQLPAPQDMSKYVGRFTSIDYVFSPQMPGFPEGKWIISRELKNYNR